MDGAQHPEDLTSRLRAPRLLDGGRRAERPYLLVLRGPHCGELLPLRPPALVLGRGSAAQLRLCAEGVSRTHARLSWQGATWVLEDLGSRNGTRLNRRRIRRAALREGDQIELGAALLRFGLMDGLEARFLWQMYEAALRDGLTGVFNKRYFLERLRSEVAHAARHGRPLSLLLLDVDHFKRVNDEHGHQVGDRALVAIAAALRRATRSEDVLARCGGEEFAVLCRGLGRQAAERLADRVRRTVAASIIRGAGRRLRLSVSVGVAELGPEGRPAEAAAEDLLDRADQALYAAKAAGRNCVRTAPPGPGTAEERRPG